MTLSKLNYTPAHCLPFPDTQNKIFLDTLHCEIFLKVLQIVAIVNWIVHICVVNERFLLLCPLEMNFKQTNGTIFQVI